MSLYQLNETENTIIINFEKFNLTPELMRGLAKMNFINPSPVQDAAISPMLDRRDVLVQAPTGTGKTAAFGIPVVENTDPGNSHIQTVILCPTRELAVQTTSVLKQLVTCKPRIRILALYGGEPIYRQITALKRRPQIIVATPGRMLDHIKRRTTRLNHVNSVVLDEADRMLDMGFREDITTIFENVPNERQTVLFSATMSGDIKKIAKTYQKDTEYISIKQNALAVEKIEQYYCVVRTNAKTPALIELLKEKQFGLSLIFVATKSMADSLANQLNAAGYSADAIHGDLRQSQRDSVMRRYRDGKVKILVATDVAARGIDVNGIDAVINYDIPGDCDSYIHRIGRTGRAELSGVAYTFIYQKERGNLQEIISSTKATILPATPKDLELYQSISPDRKRSQKGKPPHRNSGRKPWNRGASTSRRRHVKK